MLWILSQVYRQVMRLRNQLFDLGILSSFKCSIPVVSIGNLTAGGNAKTPLCIFLANELRSLGFQPVILSRGYGGKLAGPHLVAQNDRADQVGDEPLLMSKCYGLKVIIAKDRVLGAKFIEQNHLGNLILLDDGFQHRYLARDINILALNYSTNEDSNKFIAGKCLPLGRFREDRNAGLKRADAIVLVNRQVGSVPQDQKKISMLLPTGLKVLRAAFSSVGAAEPDGGAILAPQEIAVFCGIANPLSFIASLEALGYRVGERLFKSDHYQFSAAEISEFRSKKPELPLVCTEKDFVKIDPTVGGIYTLPIRISPHDGEELSDWLKKKLLDIQTKVC